MQASEFTPRFCPKCKEQKNEFKDNQDIIKRCTCDYAREVRARLVKTVDCQFWLKTKDNPVPKTFRLWDPPIFKEGGKGRFKSLINTQKANCKKILYDFACAVTRKDDDTKEYAIEERVRRHQNLFVRGPSGAGKDMILAHVKFMCAMRKLSATPNPGDWATFKSDMAACNWNGLLAEEAKDRAAERYRYVNVLTIGGMRTENTKFPFKGAMCIEELLNYRGCHNGSIIFASYDFAGQYNDIYGGRFAETLSAEPTFVLLFFSVPEADALLDTMEDIVIRKELLFKKLPEIAKTQQSQKGFKEQGTYKQDLDLITEGLYFEHLFPCACADGIKDLPNTNTLKRLLEDPHQRSNLSEDILKRYTAFNTEIQNKTCLYEDIKKKVFIKVIKECPPLAEKMTEREMIETGKLLEIACGRKDKREEFIKAADPLVDRMFKE